MTILPTNKLRLPLGLRLRRNVAGLALFAALPALAVASAQTVAQTAGQTALVHPRITAAIDSSSRVTLAGSRPPRAVSADDLGAVPASMPLQGMSLVFSRTPAQQSALDALVAAQQDPSSPEFHQWLTPEQYAAQFGVADSDIAAVKSWLQQQGFTVGAVSRGHNRLTFSGTAGQVESAFAAPLHYYRASATAANPNPQKHFAPAADVAIPASLSGVVLSVGNLSSFHPRPHVKVAHQPVQAHFTSSQTGSHFLTADDLQTIYDVRAAYNAGYNGAGQSLVIIGQSAVTPSDISNYQTAINSTAKLPTMMLVPNSGTSTINPFGAGDEGESDLDLEYASTMAPGANVIFLYTGNNANDGVFYAAEYAIDNDTAPILSSSYGDCELDTGQTEYNTLNAYLEQGAAQGQTLIAAAGDQGSTDCYADYPQYLTLTQAETPSADFPASSQYVTGMGGTEFPATDVAVGNTTYWTAAPGADVVSSALSYIPEQVWNDDSASYGLSAGGGGTSIYTPRPSWQTGVPGIPAGTFRLVPDISLDASNSDAPFALCTSDETEWSTGQVSSCTSGLRDSSSQDLTLAGGTSFDAPAFAAMVAILNQAKGYTKGQGLVNPTLYSLASNPITYSTAFHDITSGGNQCTAGAAYCSTAGVSEYAATTGYDEASGLGSLDFYNLLTAWPGTPRAANTSFTVTAAGATVAPGSSASSTVTVTPSGGYTGAVSFTVTSNTPSLIYACWSLPNASITGATAATSTLTIATSEATCPSGTYVLQAKPATGTGTAANRIPALPAPGRTPAAPLAAIAAGALLAGFGLKRRTRARLASLSLSLALLAVLSLGAFGLSGCSSSASGPNITTTTTTTTTPGASTTPAGTYTITVTGVSTTNSSLVSTATFTLTVS